MKTIEKILSFLRVRSVAGGLEISDQVLRFINFDGKAWQMHALRLEPGVLESGKVKDNEKFIASLRALKAQIIGRDDKNKKMNVVVALSSLGVYSQVFNLPVIQGEDLNAAIALNVQMLSPVAAAETCSGWQPVGKNEAELRLEVLAAFADKATVDGITQALLTAGFIAVAVESRSLALVRAMRERGTGIAMDQSYLFVGIDNSGLEFLVVRKGQLYFEYANPWRDIADEKGQVSVEQFRTMLAASMRQVANFYSQHWSDPAKAIILSAVGVGEEAEQVVRASSSLPIVKLALTSNQEIPSEWLVAFGCGLRGISLKSSEKQINLLSEEAKDTFQREQLSRFVAFWRILIPAAFALLILMFVLADAFLARTKATIELQTPLTVGSEQMKESETLQASAASFNRSVALIRSIESSRNFKYKIANEISKLLAANNVTLSRLSFPSAASPPFLSGFAQTQDKILSLKAAIEANPNFGKVNLPLTAIQPSGVGSYSFSMTFPLRSLP